MLIYLIVYIQLSLFIVPNFLLQIFFTKTKF